MSINRILIATTNKGKLREFKELFKELEVEIISLEDFEEKIEVVEDRQTFLENAIKKAKEYALFYNIPTIAEDAGLEIEELGRFPGVYSARFFAFKEFGGEEPIQESADKANIMKVLRLMEGKENRKARFVSNVVFYNPDNFGLWTEGYLYGKIAEKPQGEKGFGYDPIFIPEGYSVTLAQLDIEEKNRISHRGKAVRKLLELLKKILK